VDLPLRDAPGGEGQRRAARLVARRGVARPSAEERDLETLAGVEGGEGGHAVGRRMPRDEQHGPHAPYLGAVRGSPPVVALVSLGTTPGLRHADATLAALLEEAGARCRLLRVRLGPARTLRRHIALVDAVESLAAARAGARAEADAVISSGATTAYFQRPSVPHAVWFDSPSALNRPGWGGAWQRRAERRAVARARLLLPWGQAGAAALAPHLPAGAPPLVPLGPPVEKLAGARERDVDAVTYAGWPWKRGLDVACAAWARACPPGGRLVVGGVDRARGLAWLGRCRVPEPPGVEWAGALPRPEWLALVARARVFVNASRREDYGISQLEALSAGLVLATVPSPGAYEALPLARRLAPGTVAAGAGDGAHAAGALAAALEAALSLDGAARADYAARAAELLEPYRRAAVRDRLADRVLPALLASSA
jgi:hypothetical protein